MLAIEKSDINDLKKNIDSLVGQKVLLRGSLGRNKFFEKEAVLVSTTPTHFLVKFDNIVKENFNYVDVLGNRVELDVMGNAGEYSSILGDSNQNITL